MRGAVRVHPGSATAAHEAVPGVEALTPALEREWDELACELDASPFLRPAYLRVWQASFGRGLPAGEMVVARSGGRLTGALAVARARGRIGPPGNFETPAGGIVAADEASALAVARGLVESGARRIDFGQLPTGGATHGALEQTAALGGHRVVRRVTMQSPIADTDGGWDAYWSARSRNLRHNVERCRRRAREAGDLVLDVRSAFAPGELEALLAEGFAVEGSGWKTAQGTAILTNPETRRYYSDLAAWAADEGWLRLSFLRLADRPIAFCLGVEAFGVHHALKMGYDPELRRMSPGVLLLEALIRRAFDDGLARFDFAGHAEPYKMAWATGTEEQILMSVFPRTLAGRAAHRAERARIALAESRLRPLLRPAVVAARDLAARARPRHTPHDGAAARRET